MSTDIAVRHKAVRHKDVALLELLDRVLDKGVVVAGDVTISVADIDLIYLSLRVLLCSIESHAANELRSHHGRCRMRRGQVTFAIQSPPKESLK